MLGPNPPGDSSFTLEDEHASTSAEAVFSGSVCVTDPTQSDNPLVFVSPGFESLTGYHSSEVLGCNCRLLQGGKEQPNGHVLSTALAERHYCSVELQNYRKDGTPFTNLLSVAPVTDSTGSIQYFMGVQVEVKSDLQEEQARLSRVQEQVEHCLKAFVVLEWGEPSTITAVSPAFSSLTGYSQPEVFGQSLSCLCGPDSNEHTLKKLSGAVRAGPAGAKLLCYKRCGTPFWAYIYCCSLPPATPKGGRRELCVFVDVTLAKLRKVGKYYIGKVIGSGAFGLVRKGKNIQTDEVVAVKVIDATRFRSITEVEQVQEEMNVLAGLKHPHIIRLYDVHFVNNAFHLVMEFAPGGSLVQYVRSRGEKNALPEADAQRIFLQMLSALDYCHRRRVIHRDLKPENILMDDRYNIKIADFGLAAVAAPYGSNLTLQCGTPEFTAPEITSGREYEGSAVDIFSMGVILYEILAGQLPFKGSTAQALQKAIQRGYYEQLPGHISADCKDLVRRMLLVDPSLRITMEDMQRHAWCRAGGGVRSARPSIAGTPCGELASEANNGGSNSGLWSPSSGGGGAVPQPFHDSVRVVIPHFDKDDPITAAIMRGQRMGDLDSSPNSNGGADELRVMPSGASYTPGPAQRSSTPGGVRPGSRSVGGGIGVGLGIGALSGSIAHRKPLPPLSSVNAAASSPGPLALLSVSSSDKLRTPASPATRGSARFKSPSRAATSLPVKRLEPQAQQAQALPPITHSRGLLVRKNSMNNM